MHPKYSILLEICSINNEIGGKTKKFTSCLIKWNAVRMEVTLVPRILDVGIKSDAGRKSVSIVWEVGGAAELI
jgi:hypothetical protein